MRKPRGHIRKRPFGYEIAVPEGRDPITKRYQYRYEYAATLEAAEAARDRMVADVTSGREPRTRATFGELLDKMLEVADLDFTTRGMYQGYIERTIRPEELGLTTADFAQKPDAKFGQKAEAERALREATGYRLYLDLERGWRVTMPKRSSWRRSSGQVWPQAFSATRASRRASQHRMTPARPRRSSPWRTSSLAIWATAGTHRRPCGPTRSTCWRSAAGWARRTLSSAT